MNQRTVTIAMAAVEWAMVASTFLRRTMPP